MKDEWSGQHITKFGALRLKMYSFILNNKEKKKAKGVKIFVVEEDLNFYDYFNALFNNKEIYQIMKAI